MREHLDGPPIALFLRELSGYVVGPRGSEADIRLVTDLGVRLAGAGLVLLVADWRGDNTIRVVAAAPLTDTTSAFVAYLLCPYEGEARLLERVGYEQEDPEAHRAEAERVFWVEVDALIARIGPREAAALAFCRRYAIGAQGLN